MLKRAIAAFLAAFSILTRMTFGEDPMPPPPPFNAYQGEASWNRGGFTAGYEEKAPDSGLVAFVYVDKNEIGYPMRTSVVKGISDTTTMKVRIEKRRGGGYPIGSLSPETWFLPVIYDIHHDRRKMPPIGDSSTFHYKFLYWENYWEGRVSKPDTIPPISNEKPVYYLRYSVWGLPPGRYLLTMLESSMAPGDLKLCMNYTNSAWISNPNDLQDTLSAYAGCVQRAIWADSLAEAKVWADTILYFNPKSLIGYRQLAQVLHLQRNRTAALVALDSAIAIADRYGDPALPVESGMNKWQQNWYQCFIIEARWTRWCIATGKFPKLN